MSSPKIKAKKQLKLQTSKVLRLNRLDWIDWEVIRSDRWDIYPDGRRKRCAEVMIIPSIPIQRIWRFVVNNIEMQDFILENQAKYFLNSV